MDVDLIVWVGVWLGGTYGCGCGILYDPMLGGSILCGVFKCQTWVEKYTSAELC